MLRYYYLALLSFLVVVAVATNRPGGNGLGDLSTIQILARDDRNSPWQPDTTTWWLKGVKDPLLESLDKLSLTDSTIDDDQKIQGVNRAVSSFPGLIDRLQREFGESDSPRMNTWGITFVFSVNYIWFQDDNSPGVQFKVRTPLDSPDYSGVNMVSQAIKDYLDANGVQIQSRLLEPGEKAITQNEKCWARSSNKFGLSRGIHRCFD